MIELRKVYNEEGYLVSNYGEVVSLIGKKIKILKQNTGKGYRQVFINGKFIKVHRIVAFAFPEICGEWFEGAEVDHINGIKTDNRPENLRWVSHKENMNNQITKQIMSNFRKAKDFISKQSNSHKKQISQYSASMELLNTYESGIEAEMKTGVSNGNISSCCKNKRKTAGGFVWRYF